jgi:hypothetical protein
MNISTREIAVSLLEDIGAKYLVFIFLLFVSVSSNATTLTCGLKKVTVQGNQITKIEHEDGIVHTGASVSNNWKYDGTSIKHRLLDKSISCGNKPKSRDEIIDELSGKFTEKPSLYGMNQQEAEQMKTYTASLMKTDNACHLLVDAAKSTSRKGMFYVDCNDKSSNTKRYWVSENELKQGIAKKATSPVSESLAKEICSQELKKRTNNPSTYDPSLILGASSRTIERTGRNVVEIEFKASNSFGVESKYIGRCILEGGAPIEVTIRDR